MELIRLMNKLLLICLYITAYLPLWLCIFVKNVLVIYQYNHEQFMDYILELVSTIIIIIVFVISCIYIWSSFSNFEKKNNEGRSFVIKNIKRDKNITFYFVASVVLPLAAFDFSCISGIFQFLITFCCIGTLVVKNQYICPNFFLEIIMGYSFYSAEIASNSDVEQNCKNEKIYRVNILSKRDLLSLNTKLVELRSLNNDLRIDLFSSRGL